MVVNGGFQLFGCEYKRCMHLDVFIVNKAEDDI